MQEGLYIWPPKADSDITITTAYSVDKQYYLYDTYKVYREDLYIGYEEVFVAAKPLIFWGK